MDFTLTTLPSGLRVITQPMPGVRSVALGYWVDAGTRDEDGPEAGVSHFLEHLLFKGTSSRSAQDIAEAFDAVGGDFNAFTTKEYTCFHARVLDHDLALGVEILSDMFCDPAFRPEEIDSERQVVLEEISMHEDDPPDVAHEAFVQALYAGHPLALPVLGTRDSITAMDHDRIAAYFGRRYTPGTTVVAAVGSLSHEQVLELVASSTAGWTGSAPHRPTMQPARHSDVTVVSKETEQAHLVLGTYGLARNHPDRWAMTVANHIIGGGMSSRLFQELREKRGLAYSVYSFRSPFEEVGAWAAYIGTSPGLANEALALIRAEIDRVVAEGVTADELNRAQGHMRGSLALSMEDPASLMHRLGRAELCGMEHLSTDDIVAFIDAVSVEDVKRALNEVLSPEPFVLGAVGPFGASDLDASVLAA